MTTMTDQFQTVGQVAEAVGVTVRTLHHYDDIGLVTPSERSFSGYRLYTRADLERLQHVVVYRRLGFGLEEIATLLDGGGEVDLLTHLRRQRETVRTKVAGLEQLVAAIDRALEAEMNGYQISKDEQREIFGNSYDSNFEDYEAEAKERWGDTDAWKESSRRTKGYTKAQWQQVKDEGDALNQRYVELMQTGVPADSIEAREVAEEARQQICRWFYDCSLQMHAGIAQMYVDDPRFRQTYEDIAPGLATYVRDAVVAHASRG